LKIFVVPTSSDAPYLAKEMSLSSILSQDKKFEIFLKKCLDRSSQNMSEIFFRNDRIIRETQSITFSSFFLRLFHIK